MHILILFIFIVTPFNNIFADPYDPQRKQLEQLKNEHKNAMSVLLDVQRKFPGTSRDAAIGAIDKNIGEIENSLADLKLYHEGISFLNKESQKLGPAEKIAQYGERYMINKKLSKYNLEINEDQDLFIAPEMYNKYLKAMMSVASAGSGMHIPVSAIKTTQKVKIINLRESRAIENILDGLNKAKETGHKNINQLKDQKNTISNIKPLEDKIAALEKQIPPQEKKEIPKQIKKVKYVRFEPGSDLRLDWPNVPVGKLIQLKLVVVYEDGTINNNPRYKVLSGSNHFELLKEGPYILKAEVQLDNQKKVYPIKQTLYGKHAKRQDLIRSPHWFRNPFFAKETDGQIKIPLHRNSKDKTKFTVTIIDNISHSTAKNMIDYRLETREIKWQENDTTRYVAMEIIDDNLAEGTEEITLKVYAGIIDMIEETHEIVIYIEDDERGELGFVKDSIDVFPDQNNLRVGIERKGLSMGAVGVELSTIDGTAKKGKEYFEKIESIKWKGSDNYIQHVTIDLMKHKRDKERIFWAVLKKPSGGAALGYNKKVQIKLLKDTRSVQKPLAAGPSEVKFEETSYTVTEDTPVARILVSRTGDLTLPVSVKWKIYDANTDMNIDYVSDFGTLDWAANDSQPKPITIKIIDDQDPERLEHAYLELYNAQSPGQTVNIAGQNPVKLTIKDNDDTEVKTKAKELACQSIKIRPSTFVGNPGQTIRFDQTFRVIALMSDNTEVDISRDPALVWEPGAQFTFPDESKFNARLDIKAKYMDCWATARIDVEYPFWSDPISDADDLQAKAASPPADAYDWYVVCNKINLDIVYTQHLDLTRHMVIKGPFPGPREPAMWIEANCPRAKCNRNGECSQNTAVRGGPWGVYCNKNSGFIVVTKDPQGHHKKLEGNFHSLTEAQLWSEQQYPSGLCDNVGRYLEEGFGEISSRVGSSVSNEEKEDEFAQIGGGSAQRILQESKDANVMSQGGKKGFSMHNFDNVMGPEFKKKIEAQEKEAQEFLNEFLNRTTKDFYDYQKKRAEQKTKVQTARNQGQTSKGTTLNNQIHPVGPNWNPVDGWGKPGQVSAGAVKCPDNQKERQRKCAQAEEYAQKYGSMSKSSEIWAANIQRVNLYQSQCCGSINANDESSIEVGERTLGGSDSASDSIELMGLGIVDEDKGIYYNRSGDSNSNPSAQNSNSGNDSGFWHYDTRGLESKKIWGVIHYINETGPNAYVIRKYYEASLQSKPYSITFGPNTFVECRKWLFKKGYW